MARRIIDTESNTSQVSCAKACRSVFFAIDNYLQAADFEETVNILTPFKPLLHSLYYAHRHVTMLEDLLTNYQYLED
uniref:KIF-binding protein n=1 Tax=Panagrellus redivivus TaxID=6233 RepID=A0A7E4ZY44_PANRE